MLVLLVLVLASLQPCHPTAGVRPVQAPRPVPRCARLRGGALAERLEVCDDLASLCVTDTRGREVERW